MPGLSIIILGWDRPEHFEDTLASVLQHRPEDCEILVVHAESYDDPYDLGDEVRFIAAPAGCSRAAQLNLGIRESRGEVVHWLAGGLTVEEDWAPRAVRLRLLH